MIHQLPTPGFSFEVLATLGNARAGILHTPRGDILTPVFMPVGTLGTVKAMTAAELATAPIDARIILGNTYHLYLRPGLEVIGAHGGLHTFAGWSRPILTDSGGFQVFSLAAINEIDDDGVTFRSHIDGSKHRLTPEVSMHIQGVLGSDIAMCFDQCPPADGAPELIDRAIARTTAWAGRCLAVERPAGQALFGIVQGGTDARLRARSADTLVAMDFAGYAVGGLAVGESQAAMLDTFELAARRLPAHKPRYLMGVGTPLDLIEAVARGADMFDCVMPTRSGRHGQAFTWAGKVNLKNAGHAEDARPLDPASSCPASRDYSRAYLHHLVKSQEYLAAMLLSWANVAFYQELMAAMRAAIAEGRFAAWAAQAKTRLGAMEPHP